MDKETLSQYGWIVICIIIIALMLGLATPFGKYIGDATLKAMDSFRNKTEVTLSIENGSDETGKQTEPEDSYPETTPEMLSAMTFTLNENKQSYTLSNFNKDSGITNVIVPEKYNDLPVTVISAGVTKDVAGKYTSGFVNAETVILPDSATIIKPGVFSQSKITSVRLPSNLTEISEKLFYLCTNLKEITIPNTVESIGAYAFCACTKLTEIILPTSVTTIDTGAFKECKGIKSIDIPENVTSISDNCFNMCDSLENVTMANNVLSIGNYAFQSDYALKNITLSNKITSIKTCAFMSCGFEKITLPSSITSIQDMAFKSCNNLTEIFIPDSVTSIGQQAFNSCAKLSSVTLPKDLSVIQLYAFENCYALKNVNYNNTVANWSNVTLKSLWNFKCPFNIISCTDGDIAL